MRSSASAGLFGRRQAAWLGSAGHLAAPCSAVVLVGPGRVAGRDRQRDYRPAQQVGIFLVGLGSEDVRTQRPVARRDGDRNVELRLEVLADVQLGILAAHEHRDLAGTPGRFGLGSLFRAGQTRRILLRVGCSSRYGRHIGARLGGLGGLFCGVRFSRLGFGSLGFLDLGDRCRGSLGVPARTCFGGALRSLVIRRALPVSADLMSGAAVSTAGSDCVASGFASAFGASLAG